LAAENVDNAVAFFHTNRCFYNRYIKQKIISLFPFLYSSSFLNRSTFNGNSYAAQPSRSAMYDRLKIGQSGQIFKRTALDRLLAIFFGDFRQ
jgi:hypothetical protein